MKADLYRYLLLCFLLEFENTEEIREREENLLSQLVILVNQRNRLVQIEDTQLQQRYFASNIITIIFIIIIKLPRIPSPGNHLPKAFRDNFPVIEKNSYLQVIKIAIGLPQRLDFNFDIFRS